MGNEDGDGGGRPGPIVVVLVTAALGLASGYLLGRSQRTDASRLQHVEKFTDAAQAVWTSMDRYEAALQEAVFDLRVEAAVRAPKKASHFELHEATSREFEDLSNTLSSSRSVLGEPIALMLTKRAGVLRLRWESELSDDRYSREAIPAYDGYLDRTRFDSLQARDFALGQLGH